jgi:EamA-like transporter family
MTNWALEYVRASIISGVILAEPVIAALLAWAVLFERPGMWTVVGGVVVLAGLYLLLRGEGDASGPPPPNFSENAVKAKAGEDDLLNATGCQRASHLNPW